MKRRRAILGATAAVTGLAGCSELSSSPSMLTVTVINHDDTDYTVELAVFEPDGASRSEARVYSKRIPVEPEGEAIDEEALETGRYLVRYHVYEEGSGNLTDEDHIHYYPPDDGDGDLAFDIDSTGTLTTR